jgi:hypothetical protein
MRWCAELARLQQAVKVFRRVLAHDKEKHSPVAEAVSVLKDVTARLKAVPFVRSRGRREVRKQQRIALRLLLGGRFNSRVFCYGPSKKETPGQRKKIVPGARFIACGRSCRWKTNEQTERRAGPTQAKGGLYGAPSGFFGSPVQLTVSIFLAAWLQVVCSILKCQSRVPFAPYLIVRLALAGTLLLPRVV